MNYRLFLFVMYCCLSSTAYAQPGLSNRADTLVESVYSPDTVQFIRQFFSDKRRNTAYDTRAGLLTLGVGGAAWLGAYGVVSAVSAAIGAKPDQGRLALVSVPFISPGLLITGFGLIRNSRFSKKREEATVLAFQQGRYLPRMVVRRMLQKRLRVKMNH